MTINVFTYKCGLDDLWWTYGITINGVDAPRTSMIYRMYGKEETAMRNGLKRLNKVLKNRVVD